MVIIASGCASPFMAEVDYLASAKSTERFRGLVALRHVLEDGKIKEKSDMVPLMRRVFDIAAEKEEHAQNVMLALILAGRYGGVAAVPVLVSRTGTENEHWPVRQEAVRGLAGFPVPEAHNALIRVLENDTEPIVRQEAARSLGECGNRACWPALAAAAIGNPDDSVRYTACRALEKLTGLEYGTDEAKWEKWWVEQRRDRK